jgi:CHAT domain-containing protein/tetratricopeptide (TPR) repeat protein
MFLLKELSVLIAILFLSVTGLLERSNPYRVASPQTQTNITPHESVFIPLVEGKFSKEFISYKHQILNEAIDENKIISELESLNPGFEREYLLALLNKRKGDFDKSFNLLYSLLNQSIKYLYYYEELTELGKITDNLDKISRWIENKQEPDNFFNIYLNGLIEYQKGNANESIKILKSLVEKGFTSKEIYFTLAYLYRTTGDYEKSLETLFESENLTLKNESFLSKIINLRGTLYYLSGAYDRAKEEYILGLKVAQANKNRPEEIKSIANLAIIKDLYGEVDDARNDFKNAITFAEKIENNELLAFLFSELGVSFTYTNNLMEARKNYEKSYSLYRLLKNDDRLSYLSSNIGSIYLQISNYKSALQYYKKGLRYAGENKLGQILNLTGIADVYSNESNYSKALQFYNRAKEIADSIKDISSLVKIEGGIGALFYNINRPENSIEMFKKAESRIINNEMQFELINLYSMIGTVLTSIDSFKQAENYLIKGMELADQSGDIYNSIVLKTELANNFYNQNNFTEAAKYLTLAQKPAMAYELTQILALQDLYWGKIYESGNKNEQAREKLRSSFQLSERVHDLNTQIEAGYLLAQNFKHGHKYEEAEKWYLKTIDLIEKISIPLTLNQEIQIAHFSGMNNVYNSLTEFYLMQDNPKDAFMVIEKSRSRNTKTNLEKLKFISILKTESNYNQLIDCEWMLQSGLYSQKEIDSLNQVLNRIKIEVNKKYKGVAENLFIDDSKTLDKLQKELSNEEYLISAYVADNYITLFKLNSKNFVSKTINIERDSLFSLLKAISPIYNSGLENEEIYINEDLFSFNAYAANKMYRLLFKEFLDSIPKESKLIFSFPIELIKLPTELLVTEWSQDESPYYYADKSFLIEDFQISYTPSLSIYQIQKNRVSAKNKQNLLIGDPFINNSEFTLSVRGGLVLDNPTQARNIRLFPLEYSKEEINSIDGTIANNVVLLSEDATESNFKINAPLCNVVHISSHSFLLKDQPLILFSPQEDELDDGFLELGEIVQLNLNSELVVLSSCRSGLGRVDEAEGIIGMQKAFFEAGSKSVLVSLWDVSDKYTSYFMQEFYKYLKEGKSKSEALRRAKLDFINNYSANPYYWSAFVLSGNSSAIEFEYSSTNVFVYYILGLIIIGVLFSLFFKRKKIFS